MNRIVSFAASVAVFFANFSVWATCSTEQARAADLAFSGTIVEVGPTRSNGKELLMSVENIHFGMPSYMRHVIVHANTSSPLSAGTKYNIFAQKRSGVIEALPCMFGGLPIPTHIPAATTQRPDVSPVPYHPNRDLTVEDGSAVGRYYKHERVMEYNPNFIPGYGDKAETKSVKDIRKIAKQHHAPKLVAAADDTPSWIPPVTLKPRNIVRMNTAKNTAKTAPKKVAPKPQVKPQKKPVVAKKAEAVKTQPPMRSRNNAPAIKALPTPEVKQQPTEDVAGIARTDVPLRTNQKITTKTEEKTANTETVKTIEAAATDEKTEQNIPATVPAMDTAMRNDMLKMLKSTPKTPQQALWQPSSAAALLEDTAQEEKEAAAVVTPAEAAKQEADLRKVVKSPRTAVHEREATRTATRTVHTATKDKALTSHASEEEKDLMQLLNKDGFVEAETRKVSFLELLGLGSATQKEAVTKPSSRPAPAAEKQSENNENNANTQEFAIPELPPFMDE